MRRWSLALAVFLTVPMTLPITQAYALDSSTKAPYFRQDEAHVVHTDREIKIELPARPEAMGGTSRNFTLHILSAQGQLIPVQAHYEVFERTDPKTPGFHRAQLTLRPSTSMQWEGARLRTTEPAGDMSQFSEANIAHALSTEGPVRVAKLSTYTSHVTLPGAVRGAAVQRTAAHTGGPTFTIHTHPGAPHVTVPAHPQHAEPHAPAARAPLPIRRSMPHG